jgi:hypothetical protein
MRAVYQTNNPITPGTPYINQINPTPQEILHNLNIEQNVIMEPRDMLKHALQQAAKGLKPDVPFMEQIALRETLNKFASEQYSSTLKQCNMCKERWFDESIAVDDGNGYRCHRCLKDIKTLEYGTFSKDNLMDPFFNDNEAVLNEYFSLPELSEVEKRLIAKRMVVFTVYRLKGGDSGCSGDAVNLVQDINNLVQTLPRGTLNHISFPIIFFGKLLHVLSSL